MEALAKITQVSADTLTDSDDAHLTVQLLYQPFIIKRQAADGCWHNDPIDVQQSADTFANALALLKKSRVMRVASRLESHCRLANLTRRMDSSKRYLQRSL